jgi:cytochrome b561
MKPDRYHPASIYLHWIIFALFVVALASIEYRGELPRSDPMRDTLRNVHMTAGQLVLVFFVLRAAIRLRFGAPSPLPAPRWQIGAAHLVHALLYLLMIALPVTGVLFNQAGGRDISFFGWILPQFIGVDRALRGNIKEVHEALGNAVYFIVGLHALAALFHHYLMKDGALRRMLPAKHGEN